MRRALLVVAVAAAIVVPAQLRSASFRLRAPRFVGQVAGQAFAQPARRSAEREGVLDEMVRTERRFAARAVVVGWKQAFLEYFADTAVGFDGDQTAPAKSLFRKQPDPPKDLRILWEPRYGDIAASGDLGYLTGPVRTINPARNNGQPRHSIYASVWKRQPDGAFKVVMDMGVSTPGPVPFPDGFTRAPRADVYTGNATAPAAIKSLRDTDAALTNAARSGQADAYRGHLAEGARLHRPDVMPLVGQEAIVAWLAGRPAYASGESMFAETALSGDLGYTYGSYAMTGVAADHGFYVRAWTRGRDGVWRIALDVLQPQ
jgi:ketosteroid isomerase-like protein